MGLRSIGHYCFPCWISSDDEAGEQTQNKNDPQAASDLFRQGERILFNLQVDDPDALNDAESGAHSPTNNSLSVALEKFEASHSFGGLRGATVAGIFYECAIAQAKPNYKRAYELYEEAAEQGDALAKCLIATFPGRVECGAIPGDHRHRKQLLKDSRDAAFVQQDPLRWLKDAADRHFVGEAVYLLGSCIEQGAGVRKADPAVAVGLYLQAARSGIKSARRQLARCYLSGIGTEKDVLAAKYWLTRAINDNNDPEAMALLAMNYENGTFSLDQQQQHPDTHNKTMTVREAMKQVQTNDQDQDQTQNQEPESFIKWNSGPGMEIMNQADKTTNSRDHRNYKECHYWAQRSAELGSAAGIYQTARCHEIGLGVAIDLEKCVQLYREAVEIGYAPAQFSLACFYCSGCVVERRDTKKAHELLQSAAEAGYTPAMISLATLYTIESKTHVRVIETAPTNRYRQTMSASLIRIRDPKLVAMTIYDDDLKRARVWWRRAAKRNSRQAQYELALCFRDGRGIEVDLAKALYWMRQAALSGLPEAQLELGVLLAQDLPAIVAEKKRQQLNTNQQQEQQNNPLQHDNESFYWILRAAKNGLPEAQIELAQLFIEGRHVHKNTSTAFYWFKRAAKAGHPYAQYRVGTMLLDGEIANGCISGSQGSQAEAVKWLKLASDQGWVDADKLLPVALGMANEESVKAYRNETNYIY